MNTEDRTLISRLATGDEGAMRALVDRHWRPMVQYAQGLLGDWDRAEDVTQGAFVRLWADRDRWDTDSSSALLYRIVRNAALDMLRRSGRVRGGEFVDELAGDSSPESDVEMSELEGAVLAAVDALPPRRREVFRLARDRGFSYAEIAEITELSRQTVANHMSLALRDLRVMLRPFLTDTPPAHEGSSGAGETEGRA
jgi:RNA polymerase sigma-70 factor (ECF subfamily)